MEVIIAPALLIAFALIAYGHHKLDQRRRPNPYAIKWGGSE